MTLTAKLNQKVTVIEHSPMSVLSIFYGVFYAPITHSAAKVRLTAVQCNSRTCAQLPSALYLPASATVSCWAAHIKHLLCPSWARLHYLFTGMVSSQSLDGIQMKRGYLYSRPASFPQIKKNISFCYFFKKQCCCLQRLGLFWGWFNRVMSVAIVLMYS